MSFTDFVVFLPGHGRSVTDFWDWDAHEARLRCHDDVSGDIGGCSARRVFTIKTQAYKCWCLLIVHLSIILATDQLNAQILFYNKFIIFLYMIRALCAHNQEVKLYYTASIIVTLCRWPFGAQVDLLMISTILLIIRRPNCIIQHLVSSQSVGGRSVHRTIPDAL